MGRRLYKATGRCMTAVTAMLGIDMRVSGLETLPDGPVLFVVNHFTRFETFLVPYAIHHRFDSPVRTLATHRLFGGGFGRYLAALGVLSTRDPLRNRTIVGDLMTGRAHWVIYPEGGLIKNKKMVRKGKLWLTREERQGTPHTGAAVMALKSELRKRRYLDACAQHDEARMSYYEKQYDLSGPEDVSPTGTRVVPVNITYPRLRSRPNLLHRFARLVSRTIDPRLDEELLVEGTILFHDAEVSIHFDEPIDVAGYLGRSAKLARRAMGWLDEPRRADLFLARPARRLMNLSMRRIYNATEINLDHLFCCGLRLARRDVMPAARFRKALFLAVTQLRAQGLVRLHPVLLNGIIALATGDPFTPLEDIERLATEEGVISRRDGDYVIHREALEMSHDFHDVRLKKMVQVIANELEPLEGVVDVLREAVNLDEDELHARLSAVISETDRQRFHSEYERWHTPGVSKPEDFGEPFLLEARRPRAGIVLAHGYLASPEQVRPMAEFLHARDYSVYVVRLEGHGTAPEHLGEVTWRGWLESMKHACTVIGHHCDRRIVGGFSLGGVLATVMAASAPDEVDGLFTINAPMKLRHRWAPLVPAVFHLTRAARRLPASRDLSRLRNESESPEINYESKCLWSIRELRYAIRACRKDLHRVTAPAVVIQSDRDPIVDPVSAEILINGLGSTSKTLVRIPSDRHLIVRGDDAERVCGRVEAFLERVALRGGTKGLRD